MASGSYSSTVGGGYYNTASGYYSTVGGGASNTASGNDSTVGGGLNNIASGDYSAILGGQSNNDNGHNNVFILGSNITATQANTTFVENLDVASSGDIDTLKINKLYHQNLAVATGIADSDLMIAIVDPTGSPTTEVIQGSVLRSSLLNQPAQLQFRQGTDAERLLITPASGEPIWTTDTQKFYIGDGSTVGGDFFGPGPYLPGSGVDSVVVSNSGCEAIGNQSVVLGGINNLALSSKSFIGGGTNNVAAQKARRANNITSSTDTITVLDATAADFDNVTANALQIRYVFGGTDNLITRTVNTATQSGSSVTLVVTPNVGASAQTWSNVVVINTAETNTSSSITIGGGQNNISSNNNSTVSGGNRNSARGIASTVGGGNGNTSSGFASTVGGGTYNTASGSNSTVGGGNENTASNAWSTVGGGNKNTSSEYGSVVCGGRYNLSSGQGSVVAGGRNNTSSGYNSTVGGGGGPFGATSDGNVASGDQSTVGGGQRNTASGTSSTVGGGNENTASGFVSTVGGGLQGKATRWGENSHASGRFANNGDAQHTVLIARRLTTDNTANQVLFLNGSNARLTLPAKTTWTFEIKLSAYNDTDNAAAGWIYRGVIKRDGSNNTSLVGSLIEENWKDSAMNSASASVVADDTNEALEIRVTGLTSKNIRWVAVVDISQVSYGTP
jgi:hypothetical protein